MNETNDGIFSILRREPEKTSLILKLGFGGPVVIVLWDWLATYLLPELAVSLVTLFAILVYAGALTFMIAGLVHAADRWQVESALQARRLLTGKNRQPQAAPRRAAASHP